MTTRTLVLRSLVAAAGAAVVVGCSSDPEPAPVAAAAPTAAAAPAAPSAAAPGGSATSAAAPSAGAAAGTGTADDDDVELEDQSGDGSSVVVEEVDARSAGWIVVTDSAGAVLGATAVPAGDNRDVTVPLATAVTANGELTATLHSEDGDGAFDATTDPAVLEDEDDDDDDDDRVDDDADYRIG